MAEPTGTYSVDQVNELLTCPICLDRFTQPKILPCQHTFCLSPCLERLIDFRARLIRCPECRAEHFVPYNGAQGFPNNLTIVNFLDLPPQPQGSSGLDGAPAVNQAGPVTEGSTRKCAICETETDTTKCVHCDKMVCDSCRRSHTGQMKFDIGRLINQIRRGVPKISNTIGSIEQKSEHVKQHVEGIKSEVHDTVERYAKELRDREKLLHSELETFLQGELRNLRLHQENLEVELASISSYCDSTESQLNRSEGDIAEADLVNFKHQCSEYMKQIQQTENGSIPDTKQVRFQFEGQNLHSNIVNFGSLVVATPGTSNNSTNASNNNSRTAHARPSNTVNEARQSRQRWSDAEPLHGLLGSLPDSPQPSLDTVDVTSRLRSPPRSRSPPRNRLPSRTQDYVQRSLSNSNYARPGAGFYSFDVGNSVTSPRTTNPTTNTYMFRMDTDTDSVLRDLAMQRRVEQEFNRRRNVSSSLFTGRDGHMDNFEENRTVGFIGGGGRVGRASPREQRLANRDEQPTGLAGGNLGNTTTRAHTPPGPRQPVPPSVVFDVSLGGSSTSNRGRRPPQRLLRGRSNNIQGETENNASESATQEDLRDEHNQASPEGPDEDVTQGMQPSLQRRGTFVMPALLENANGGGALDDSSVDVTLGDLTNEEEIASAVIDSRPTSRSIIDYQSKGVMMKIIGGQRGNAHGKFTWPRGVAVSPLDGNLLVADSSNHRVQIFDNNFQFVSTFGSYGAGEGEFDCLAGVAINTTGDIIIADRYNHRVQVFDRFGQFQLMFGQEGTEHGHMNYPWGVAVDSSGFIYVCDKENHRVQVFQHNGTFVRAFGGVGSEPGLLENPHYVCVSHDNRVYVSDTNNHRIQVFNHSGQFLRTLGTEGSEPGQLKSPKGLAVDRQGYVVVADSGNNRVQVFNPDGRHLCAFGEWGVANGQFKGMEGVGLSQNGLVVVSDKENHRIQMF